MTAAHPPPVITGTAGKGRHRAQNENPPSGILAILGRFDLNLPKVEKPSNTMAVNRLEPKDQVKETVRVAGYSYRYYDPVTGRWPSRDPIGEGTIIDFNLYAFTANRSTYRIDFLGLRTEIDWEDYWKQYKEKYPDMTDQQKRWAEKMLALGCKGVTCLSLGNTPDNKHCFKTKEAAVKKQEELNKKSRGCCAKVYSIHFWNDGKDGDAPEVTFSREGKADMGDWNESSQPGDKKWIAFDFGFLNPDGTITHADQYYNPDRDGDGDGDYFPKRKYPNTPIRNKALIYISTEEDWRKSYPDFNEEVWCTQCISNKAGPTE